jgi:CBS domain containing-hemolysin-like protein
LLISVLIAGTLFFSVSAVALRTFSRVKLQDAFDSRNRRSTGKDPTERLVKASEQMVLTCLFFRLILSTCILLTLVGIFGEVRQGPLHIGDYLLAFVIALIVFSLFVLAIPHAWAKYAGEKFLSRTCGLLLFFNHIAGPVLFVLGVYDRIVRRLAGVVQTTAEERQDQRQEEFLNGLEQRKIEGVVDEEQQEMIENILELSETTAEQIMTPRTDIVAVEAACNLQAVLNTINTAGHTRVPVYEDNIDRIIGFVYAKDLLTEVGRSADDFTLRSKIRDAYFVPETKPLRVLLHEFQNQKLHIAVVLDEYGGTAGIVTLEDILEELVGEIADEYEKTPPNAVKKIDDDTIETDARTYVDDLNDDFGLNLPEDEDYDTVGGFVFSHLGYIPKTSETFDYENLKFTVTAAEPRRIRRIRIQKAAPSEP